jgi:hypothetical protein
VSIEDKFEMTYNTQRRDVSPERRHTFFRNDLNHFASLSKQKQPVRIIAKPRDEFDKQWKICTHSWVVPKSGSNTLVG